MMKYVNTLVILIAALIAIGVICFLIYDYKKQNLFIIGREYRKIHGEFSFEQCVKSYKGVLLKNLEWTKQKNGGFRPETYKKRIKYISHLEDSNCLLSRKGL